MNDTDKVKMILNIGGEHLPITVDFNRQEIVRDAEKIASDKFKEFRQIYPKRSDREILAMVAYQVAYYYQEILNRYREALQIAEELDHSLDTILGGGHDTSD